MPYKAAYPSDFNNSVSDSNLLLVMNTYKYWEQGDLKALRGTMGDSVSMNGDNFIFSGRTDSLTKLWQTFRDSLSSVEIKMDTWAKLHNEKDSSDYINVWYKEIDTYKMGRVDSANFSDVNQIKNGKLTWLSQYKQRLKK